MKYKVEIDFLERRHRRHRLQAFIDGVFALSPVKNATGDTGDKFWVRCSAVAAVAGA
jgi:hypothetical protein